jgi:hypothetical protein
VIKVTPQLGYVGLSEDLFLEYLDHHKFRLVSFERARFSLLRLARSCLPRACCTLLSSKLSATSIPIQFSPATTTNIITIFYAHSLTTARKVFPDMAPIEARLLEGENCAG